MLDQETLGEMLVAAISLGDTLMLHFTLHEGVLSSSDAANGIILACELGLTNSLALILEAGYTAGDDAMLAACRYGYLDVVRLLLQHGLQLTETSRRLLRDMDVSEMIKIYLDHSFQKTRDAYEPTLVRTHSNGAHIKPKQEKYPCKMYRHQHIFRCGLMQLAGLEPCVCHICGMSEEAYCSTL